MMIVKYMWMTDKTFNARILGNKTLNRKTTEWEGWFLFGIIPLIIKATGYTYYRRG